VLGFTNLHDISDVVAIANILPIDSFDPDTLQNDIAIVQLNRPAKFNG
jgi:DNA/RNA-binding domain of Phe-tRNA-synthetase-like protein